MDLHTKNFSFHPNHFAVRNMDFVEMKINFFPTELGLHVDCFYMLCDNNTFEAIDLIGDAINFTTNMLRIEV